MPTEAELRQIRQALAQKGQDLITAYQNSEEKLRQDKQEENRRKASERAKAKLLKRKNTNTIGTMGARSKERAAARKASLQAELEAEATALLEKNKGENEDVVEEQ